MTTTSDYMLEWLPSGTKNTVILRGVRDGEEFFRDEVNLQREEKRKTVIDKLFRLGCEREQLDGELLRIAEESCKVPKPESGSQPPMADEIDIGHVHRPERIITKDTSAICIPILGADSRGVHGRWRLYVLHDGKRQVVDLAAVLNFASNRHYIETIPPEPTVNDSPGWSRKSRADWLAGNSEVDAADLFTRLVRTIDHYVEFPSERRHGYLTLLACWIVLTYVYNAWPSVGYLLVNGPASSGKSTLFEILKRLAFRPMATDNISAAAIYRTLHNYGGTLLFDEAERLRDTKSPDIAEINSMLLAGYQRGRGATRLEKVGDGFKTVNYNVYGPKAIACINGVLPALQSRCIEIRTQRAANDSQKPKRQFEETNWETLRDDLHVLAIEHGPQWVEAAQRRDIGQRLNGRDFELWQPLLAIASFFEGAGVDGLLDLMESGALQSCDDSRELKTPEADEVILSVLKEAITIGLDVGATTGRVYHPTSAEVLEVCRSRAESMFKSWSPEGISRRLRGYGLATVKSGSRREYRTDPDRLQEILTRYGIDL